MPGCSSCMPIRAPRTSRHSCLCVRRTKSCGYWRSNWERPTRSAASCGPTVICAITGKPLSEVLAVIKDDREHFARDLERHRCDPALVQLPDLSGLEFVSQLRSRGSQVLFFNVTATT